MSLGWARLTIAALEHAGVRRLVVCPGSRSAPLAVAVAESSLETTAIFDERSAAFFALGQAKATGLPSAVICTSGTAGAHFFPAVIEASHAAVPMIIITADRPPELHGCGAPQTIDQQHLFGRFVREFADLGCARTEPAAKAALATAISRAVATSRGPHPGPVHLNAPARKPLLGDDYPTPRIESGTLPLAVLDPDAEALAHAAERIAHAERPLIVVGPMPATETEIIEAVARLAKNLGAPIFAEASSQLRFGHADLDSQIVASFDELLRADGFRVDAPDAIVEVGAPPTSAGYARALASHGDIWRVAVRCHTASDPARNAAACIVGDVARSAAAIAPREPRSPENDFTRRWQRRSRAADSALRARSSDVLAGQTAVRAIVSSLPAGSQLVIGNSLAIRWLDQVAAPAPNPIAVHSQRGVAGIDGLIAGAAGVAAATGEPTCLILGDVSCAHDIGSLATAATLESPLVICVLDNRGGRIFAELPYAATLDATTLERLFVTEPKVDLATAASAYGVEAATCSTVAEITATIETAMSCRRATLVRVVVDPRSPGVLS